MSVENRALVRKTIEEIFNRKRLGLIEVIYASNCQGNSPDGSFKTREGFSALLERYVTAFPDFRFNIQHVIAEDDWVAMQYTFLGTNTGPFAGMPSTGQMVSLAGFVVSRIANNKIVEQYFMWDNLNARRQLQLWKVFAA
jgi:steroid delta-isomerase-like uncharacterized protein